MGGVQNTQNKSGKFGIYIYIFFFIQIQPNHNEESKGFITKSIDNIQCNSTSYKYM